jgi:hypothetical protein
LSQAATEAVQLCRTSNRQDQLERLAAIKIISTGEPALDMSLDERMAVMSDPSKWEKQFTVAKNLVCAAACDCAASPAANDEAV